MPRSTRKPQRTLHRQSEPKIKKRIIGPRLAKRKAKWNKVLLRWEHRAQRKKNAREKAWRDAGGACCGGYHEHGEEDTKSGDREMVIEDSLSQEQPEILTPINTTASGGHELVIKLP